MISDIILSFLIACDFGLFIFCIALMFVRIANGWLEVEALFRVMCGVVLFVTSYYISQVFLSPITPDPAMNTLFFWFMGIFVSGIYISLQLVVYILEKIDYAASKMEANVSKIAKSDMDRLKEDMKVEYE